MTATLACAQALAYIDRPETVPVTADGTLEVVLPDWQWRRPDLASPSGVRLRRIRGLYPYQPRLRMRNNVGVNDVPDVPRSGARPTTPRPAHNSVRVQPSISWWLIPLAPIGCLQERFSFFPSIAVSADADQACRSSTADCGKTRFVAYRCLQTPQLAAELPLAYAVWALTTSFPKSSGNLNTLSGSVNRCVAQT